MSKKGLLAAAQAAVEKCDLGSPEGKAKAAAAVRALREKANREMHQMRAELKSVTDLLRTLEPQIDHEARRRRGRGSNYVMLPATKSEA